MPVRVSDLRGEKIAPSFPDPKARVSERSAAKARQTGAPLGETPNLGERKTLRLGGLEAERPRVFKGERGAAEREALWQAPGGESLGGLKAQESTGSAPD